jgi:hypothetical protein
LISARYRLSCVVLCTSRELSGHTHFVPPSILEPSTSVTGKDTVVRFNQQLHTALLFLNLLGPSHHFLTVFGSALVAFDEALKSFDDRRFGWRFFLVLHIYLDGFR